ncbi:MAG: aminoglycoside phosphotransferase family protein [Yoonia sp.]|uniref:aminoglycoside phosphotransferase family protein n=1 Tax=Yoonia sp. TaxID=2212373 RepID=UPI0032630015
MNDLLHHFAVSLPSHVADTPIATVWKVTQADGTAAALKVYKDGSAGEEAPGFDLLRAWEGRGAARLLGRTKGAALLEWLDGPTLGDMVRDESEEIATIELGQTARRLHAQIPVLTTPLPSLADRFNALMTARYETTCPQATKVTIDAARGLAANLLPNQKDIRPLHGDLHHDNIKGSGRGFLAFDAKGVLGERTYDLANALRNPIGAEDHYRQPAVIQHRVKIWAAAFDVSETRLLQWAAAHAALSLAWTNNGLFKQEEPSEIALIDQFLAFAHQTTRA